MGSTVIPHEWETIATGKVEPSRVLTDEQWGAICSARYARQFREFLTAPGLADHRGLIPAGGLSRAACRALGISSAVSAGYLTPVEVSRKIWKVMTASSAMRGAVTVVEGSGNEQVFPFLDDTANLGRILAEHGQAVETDIPVSLRRIPTFMHSSDILRCSIQLSRDVGEEDFEFFILEMLGERVARLLNWTATVGAGANSPGGVVTGATVAQTGGVGQTTTVTYADLVALKGSVPTFYVYGKTGQENRAKWMMHRDSYEKIQGLLDGSGNPIWKGDDEGKTPGSILNHPVIINDDMPQMAASAKSILFGDFSKYLITDAAAIITVLPERYADYAQIGYHVATRHGGQLIDPAGIACYQNSAT